jgi:aspartate carbamoyltransferase catalytic subunit
MLVNTKENMRILHPLPRVNEIDEDVDENMKAYYFTQALNGVYTRQAIITSILGLK